MSKRFVDTERRRKELRGVDPKLRLAFNWLWENCDAAGVWSIDHDLFKFECGYRLDIDALLKTFTWIRRLSNGSLFLTDFVPVNYGTLKPGYNPHKPVFRSLEANGIEPLTLQFQDLPNPWTRVEEEGEDEDKGSSEKEHAHERRGPDPNITAVCDHLTTALQAAGIAQSLDGTAKDNRFAAATLLKKLVKDYPQFPPLDSAKHLIDAAMADEFHCRNSTSVRYLLNNCGKIAAASKARKQSTKNQSANDYAASVGEALREHLAKRSGNAA